MTVIVAGQGLTVIGTATGERTDVIVLALRARVCNPAAMTSPDDLPPHPDDYRDENGITDYERWQAALAVWRGADTEAAPPVDGQGRNGE